MTPRPSRAPRPWVGRRLWAAVDPAPSLVEVLAAIGALMISLAFVFGAI
ncbi:MAG: hypothetical protein ABIQ53_01105 [Terracoccus sp.]